MAEERILWEAEFNPKLTTYWLLSGALFLTVTVVGIVLLPIWFLAGRALTGHYLKTYRCTLTNRSLKVAKGLFVKTEKTVPLDRITDLGLVQGPIMRFFNIEAMSVETAGQSAEGSLIQVVGIKEGRKFRDSVLAQRDVVVGSEEDRQAATVSAPPAPNPTAAHNEPILEQIRDSLLRIEEKLEK